jgi:hypothetical protein
VAIVEVHMHLEVGRILYGLRFPEDHAPAQINPRLRWLNPLFVVSLTSVRCEQLEES